MGFSFSECITVVTKQSQKRKLKRRWSTSGAMQFGMAERARNYAFQQMGADAAVKVANEEQFDDLMEEAQQMFALDQIQIEESNNLSALNHIQNGLREILPVSTIDRNDISTYRFDSSKVIVVIGPDGLVANTAKYATGIPIIGVNPDPSQNQGILVPFTADEASRQVRKVLDKKARTRNVTLAKVQTNDEQTMLAFNDFFIGARSHVSARYYLEFADNSEQQSSSGVIVSTGAGSTGWLSSVFNMVNGVNRASGVQSCSAMQFSADSRQLFWCVREPYISPASGADHVCGQIKDGNELVIGSQMAENGTIFSDGIEEDAIEFNTGTIARFSIAEEQAILVTA